MIGQRSRIGLGWTAALLGLSACVSDALPREMEDAADDGSSDERMDARDASASDAAPVDATDALAPQDGGIPEAPDVYGDEVVDVTADVAVNDASDDRDSDANDGPSVADTGDAGIDAPTPDVDDGARIDVSDASTPPSDAVDADAVDDRASIDVSDASAPPSDTSDAGGTADAVDDRDGAIDASDAATDAKTDANDAADGGAVVFYTENFDAALGSFSSAVNVCGTAANWANVSGYAHASEPSTTGVTRISSPPILVPAGATNVTLRMSHKFDLEDGWDSAQLLIAVNSGTGTLVTTFTSGGYTSGGATNPTTCSAPLQSQYPGWSGLQTTEEISMTNLASVVGNNTVTITFQILTDQAMGGNGWDINWVTLSATVP
jgi:hypothetical protein